MLACLLRGPGKVVVEEVPSPTLGPGDVSVRLQAAGVCGTDLEKIHGTLGPGGVLGHEVSGLLEEVGPGVKDLEPGERIVAHHHVPCYRCYFCQHSDYTMCDSFKTTNFEPCGLAEAFRVPEFNVTRGAVIPLPSQVSFEEAAMVEPTACCIRALQRAEVRPGDNVLIVGLGPTGLTHLQLLRRMGAATILGSDIQKRRLDMAKKMGADVTFNPAEVDVEKEAKRLTGTGVDLAIVATGNPKALSQAFASARKGGKVLLFGAPGTGATFNLDISSLFKRQISVITSYSCVEAEINSALRLLSSRTIDLSSMITHRFPLKDAVSAFESAGSPEAVKTIIVP